MDSYFGKIKSKTYVAPVYTYSNMREYVDAQNNHIRHLEEIISTLIQDITLLDNKIRSISKT
jgi:hypothetical protein